MDHASEFRAEGKSERRELIAELVLERQRVSAGDLAERFGVSLMTIHRDLDHLEQLGLVRRFHGGAQALRTAQFEPDVNYRMRLATGLKREIAHAALQFIHPESSMILDDSTSSLAVADLLPDFDNLIVASHFLEILNRLATRTNLRLIGLGGEYVSATNSFQGAGLFSALNDLRVDVLFASSAGIDPGGVYHQEPSVQIAKRALMACAQKRILLIDHTKFGQTALHRISDLAAWDAIIVDSKAGVDQVSALRDGGGNVIVAPALTELA